ncbi:hypothetical protein RB653_005836 [Dictyostelium firmibasis]|uniref:Uncharacterized protein n=1 Tax=Dictyostelium firmibasis TaxID=79012 RepID=A0AAN7U7Y8_9MYCE
MFKTKLNEFLEKNTKTSNIDVLSDYRIGIEAKPWLLKLPVQEPFQITMGGLPLTLVDTLEKELNKFKKANIKPFFLFNGLSVLKERYTPINQRSQKLSTAWDAYYRAQYSSAEKCFQDSEKNLLLSFIHFIIQYFKQKGIEFFEAPYFAGPQLALFSEPSQKNYLNAVYGSQELLLYGVYRLITDIDYEKGSYTWVDLKSILYDLGLTHDQFIDACLLCGFEYCPQLPFLMSPQGKDCTFKTVCDMVKTYNNGIDTIRTYLPMGQCEKYIEQFIKTKCLVHNHLLFYSSNVCEPLFKDIYYRPYFLNQIFGPRLPNDVYFYISQGVVSPQVINNFISGILAEPFPTIESEEYCKMLDYLKNVRTKTLGLLSICLNDDLKHKPVKTIRWFEPKEFDMPHTTSLHEYHEFTNGYIKVPTEIISTIQNLVKDNTSTGNVISFGLVSKYYEALHNCMIKSLSQSPPEQLPPIRDINEGIFVTLAQTMSMMGYFNNASNDPSKKLLKYSQCLENVSNTKLQEPTLLLIELLRSGSFTFERLNFVPKPTFDGPPSKPSVFIISRVLSLIPSQLDNTPWGGPIDHDLMGFHEITRTLYKSLRNLIEMTALSHFLTHRIVLPPPEYFTFSTRLPFFLQPSSSMGLLVKGLLLENLSLEQLEEIFPNFTNIKEDLALASQFWDIAFKIVTTIYNEGNFVSKTIYDAFVEADKEWREIMKNFN